MMQVFFKWVLLCTLSALHGPLAMGAVHRGERVSSLQVGNAGYLSTRGGGRQAYNEGDLTCMRWTGGSCSTFGCNTDRGPTQCIENRCLCSPGYCATAWGICEVGVGKSIGTFAIRFQNPFDVKRSYIGARQEADEGAAWQFSDSKGNLIGTEDASAQWKLVLTPKGFVRFESAKVQNQVLTIYNNRRRRSSNFLQEVSQALTSNDTHHRLNYVASDDADGKDGISSDADLWPVLRDLHEATPISASFQIRELARTGAVEIWDPEHRVSLSSSDAEGWFDDMVAAHGVAECYPAGFWGSSCENREQIHFEPPIPAEAMRFQHRVEVNYITSMNWWQSTLLFITIFGGCLACQCACVHLKRRY